MKTSDKNGPIRQLQPAADQAGKSPEVFIEDLRPEATVQRQLQSTINAGSALVQRQENKTGLPDNLKSGIENLSGIAMDDVRVHRNSDKPAQLNAHAYAQGTDIHLASGQEKHLPHEAWHVVQQKQGRVKPTMQMKGKVAINDDAGLEREADVMGAKALGVKEEKPVALQKQKISQKSVQRIRGNGNKQRAKGRTRGAPLPGKKHRRRAQQEQDLIDNADQVELRLEEKKAEEAKLKRQASRQAHDDRLKKADKNRKQHQAKNEGRVKYLSLLDEARPEWEKAVAEFKKNSIALKSLVDETDVGDLKSKAGQKRANVNMGDETWEGLKENITGISNSVKKNDDNLLFDESTLNGIEFDVNTSNKFLRAEVHRLRKESTSFKERNERVVIMHANFQRAVKTMDEIKKSEPGTQNNLVVYDRVYIHKKLKINNFNNIPFAALQDQTQTGTHGKNPNEIPVHKKLSGGYAITFLYKDGDTFITDCGGKSPNGKNTYKWDRSGEHSYASTVAVGEKADYEQF